MNAGAVLVLVPVLLIAGVLVLGAIAVIGSLLSAGTSSASSYSAPSRVAVKSQLDESYGPNYELAQDLETYGPPELVVSEPYEQDLAAVA